MKAIGFDCGETLIYYRDTPLNWKSLYPDALTFMATGCNYTATAACINKASLILEEYNTRLNPRTAEVCSDVIIGRMLESWGLPPDRYLSPATEHFFSFFQQQCAIYEDSLTVLEMLKRRNIGTGILTDVPYGMNKDLAKRDLSSVGILDYHIDVLLTSVDVGYRKPEPTGYVRLAQALGVEPHEMLYVGNERKDVEGANRAGVYSVLITREGEPQQWGQWKSIQNLLEIMHLL